MARLRESFTMVPDSVIDASARIGASAYLTYSLLARRVNDRGECFPKIKTIAGEQGVHRNTIGENLAKLEAAGLIIRVRSQYSNHYTLPAFAPDQPDAQKTGHLETASNDPDAQKTGHQMHEKLGIGCTENRAYMTTKRSQPNGLNKKTHDARVPLSEDDDGVPSSVIDHASGIERTGTGTGGKDDPSIGHAPDMDGPSMTHAPSAVAPAPRPNGAGTYWTEQRLDLFSATFAMWPKQKREDEAQAAWRDVWTDERYADPTFKAAFVTGIQKWLAYWREKETEVQFVPTFANWLKDEEWRIDPRGVVK